MIDDWYLNLTFYMYAVAGAPFVAFVVFYAWRTPAWKRNPVGRGLMTQAASLAAVFIYICVLLAFGVPDWVKDALRAVLLGGVTIGGTLMLRNLLVEQEKRRDEPSRATPKDGW